MKPKSNEATERPWKVEKNVSAGGVVHLAITNRTELMNWMPCSITPMSTARPVDYANANLICDAVNQFEALKACAEILESPIMVQLLGNHPLAKKREQALASLHASEGKK